MGPISIITHEVLTLLQVFEELNEKVSIKYREVEGLDPCINYQIDDGFDWYMINVWDDNTEIEYSEDEKKLTFERMTGEKPNTCFVIEMYGEPKSQNLAMEFVKAFRAKWGCLVDSNMGLRTVEETLKWHAEGNYFD